MILFSETSRKWSVAVIMDRVCSSGYVLPPPRDGGKEYEVSNVLAKFCHAEGEISGMIAGIEWMPRTRDRHKQSPAVGYSRPMMKELLLMRYSYSVAHHRYSFMISLYLWI